MRYTFLLLLLSLLAGGNLSSQTIVTGVVQDTQGIPIPFASVYLSKTTMGTMTGKEGVFSLTIPQNGEYELISSCIGFKSNALIVAADGKKQSYNIRLAPDEIQVEEVTVKAKDKNRLKNQLLFLKLFLGETVSAQNCRILNTEDLYLHKDAVTGVVRGNSLKPLQIENKALGYLVTYDLADFTFDPSSEFLRFSGNILFKPMQGNERDARKWARHRLITYYGSRMHFLRALFADSLSRENYKTCNFDLETVKSKTGTFTQTIRPLEESSLQVNRNRGFMTLFSYRPALVRYLDKHPELATELIGFEVREFQSTLQFTKTVKIFPDGHVNDPYSIIWGGEMANERLADMLPLDFQPHGAPAGQEEGDADESPPDRRLAAYRKTLSKDQVFVHLDRNCYHPGDTVYFQAYVRNRFTGAFQTESSSLYALLTDENRLMADSSRYKIVNSAVSGWMTVPAKAEAGKYHFAAFTGGMQNYDPADAFQQELFVKDPDNYTDDLVVNFSKEKYSPGDTLEAKVIRKNPNRNVVRQQKFSFSFSAGNFSGKTSEIAPNLKGESVIRLVIPDSLSSQPRLKLSVMEDSKSGILTKEVEIPFDNQYFELKFLPEGGTWTAGLRQRVGFNATDFRGEPIIVEGLLKSRSGLVLDTIRSGKYGPGSFSCKADSGLYVEVTRGAGTKKIWPLPAPSDKGLSLSVEPAGKGALSIDISSSPGSIEPVTVSITLNMKRVYSRELLINRHDRLVVPTEDMTSGIAMITLFNKESMPVAQRLFFVNSDKHLEFAVKASSSRVAGNQDTELSIEATDGKGFPAEGYFSVSVTDSTKGICAGLFRSGIEYSFNYQPYLPGGLPATALAKGMENMNDEERNLLLMVYGWTRFSWESALNAAGNRKPENFDLLRMRILNSSGGRRADRNLDLVSLEGPVMWHLTANNDGEITLPLDSLPEITRSVTMMPGLKSKNKVMEAVLGIPYNAQYFQSKRLYLPQPDLPVVRYIPPSGPQSFVLGEKTIEIPEIVIVGHPANREVFHDKYEALYKDANVKSLDYEQIWSSSSLENALRKVVTPYQMTNDYVVLRQPRSFFAMGGPVTALIVLDGLPLYVNGWSRVSNIPPSEVTSLTVLFGQQGFAKYGDGAQGGVIFINTRSNDPILMEQRSRWISQHKNGNMLEPIYLYRPNIEFYAPSRPGGEDQQMVKRRATIFWQPEVYFNGKEPVRLKFNNLNHSGPVVVTINGYSVNNLVGTGTARYQIQ